MTLIRAERKANGYSVSSRGRAANAFDLEFTGEFQARLDELAADVPAGGVVITVMARRFRAA